MDPERAGSTTPWLIGAVLVAALVAAFLAWVPVARRVACESVRYHTHRDLGSWACECCGDRVKVTLLRKWPWRREAFERAMRVDPDRY